MATIPNPTPDDKTWYASYVFLGTETSGTARELPDGRFRFVPEGEPLFTCLVESHDPALMRYGLQVLADTQAELDQLTGRWPLGR